MASNGVWNVKLNNGTEIPIIGLGTFQALGEEIKTSIHNALEIGYRHFDTADYYKNLEPLGEAIREAIAAGKLTRNEVFITTKVWPTYYGAGRVEASVRRQLKQSGLEYFDLVLLHWPLVFADDDDVAGYPRGEDGKIKLGTRTLPEIYAELETIAQAGLARSIGVSNFTVAQLQIIMATAKIPPTMNQVEAHVYLQQKKLKAFCDQHNIAMTAYCPLGAGGLQTSTFNVLEDETLKKLAPKYNKTTAQVALRFLVQKGIIAIPKSIRRERLEQNFALFDFELSPEDLAAIEPLDRGQRVLWFDYFGTKESPNYPFNEY